jgi:hypothetical protein
MPSSASGIRLHGAGISEAAGRVEFIHLQLSSAPARDFIAAGKLRFALQLACGGGSAVYQRQ